MEDELIETMWDSVEKVECVNCENFGYLYDCTDWTLCLYCGQFICDMCSRCESCIVNSYVVIQRRLTR